MVLVPFMDALMFVFKSKHKLTFELLEYIYKLTLDQGNYGLGN